ncbi:MAG: hypothetical protein N4A38_03825 [Candidatus Gracilibacteria bacterium]|jgi:hypothetical protein|nr:hypothetical protein [Candidatus Gracilibacteria bacterium]
MDKKLIIQKVAMLQAMKIEAQRKGDDFSKELFENEIKKIVKENKKYFNKQN